MAPTIVADHTRTLNVTFKDDVPTGMTRIYRVHGLDRAGTDNIFQAIDLVTNTAGLREGTRPSSDIVDTDNLRLLEKSASLVDGNPSIVDVTLKYGPNDQYTPLGYIAGRGSMQQVVTEKDRFGDQIILEHEFADDDPDFGSDWKANEGAADGGKVKQGAKLNVLKASLSLSVNIEKFTADPVTTANRVIGRVNSTSWNGSAGTWLVTSVSFKPKDPDNYKWQFTYELQNRSDGWQPKAVFIDPRTGKPPKDLVSGDGVKTIQWYPTTNFKNMLSRTTSATLGNAI